MFKNRSGVWNKPCYVCHKEILPGSTYYEMIPVDAIDKTVRPFHENCYKKLVSKTQK